MSATEATERTVSSGAADAVDAARSAGLYYVSDQTTGIRRVRSGKGFRFVTDDGRAVRDPAELKRIRALVIPPAWTDVWICASPRGHIQAIGRDARHRKQYRYHARWREVRDETKYDQLIGLGEALPAIRQRLKLDLGRRGLPREKVLATVVRLLETTMMRIGNEEYARANRSFGLTTLRDRHVNVIGANIEFQFRGKSGKHHVVRVSDPSLVKVLKACQDIPGYELFQYRDESGQAQSIDSADVNAYLREIAGAEFSAKVFRTWAGTVQALSALRALPRADSEAEMRRGLVEVIREVAAQLGNTPAVCRKCYIHPAVIECHANGVLTDRLELPGRRRRIAGLSLEERLTLAFLKDWQKRQASAPAPASNGGRSNGKHSRRRPKARPRRSRRA